MEIEISESKVFTVKANGIEIEDLKAVSTWEFFIKLQNSKGESLIVSKTVPPGPFEAMFRDVFGENRRATEKGVVVGGSPSLIAMLNAPNAEANLPATAGEDER